MPSVWIKGECCVNFSEDNSFGPPKFLTHEKLKSLTGVEYYKVDVDDFVNAEEYWQLRKDRGYNYEDVVEISEKSMKKEEYNEKLRVYCAEHFHDDEEIRLFLEGSSYFDVRDIKDNWIRIHVSKGDFLILPAGVYHRFNPTKENHVKVQRIFSGVPAWTAKFRSECDETPIRGNCMKPPLEQTA